MYVRIYWTRIQPGSLPAIENKYRQLQATVPGRLLRWVTQDVADPESVITVTLWDSEESVRSWESSDSYQRGVEAVRPYLAGSQAISLYEIKVDDPRGLLDQIRSAAGTSR
jgi:heme-degrading monooxygenase HmoA